MTATEADAQAKAQVGDFEFELAEREIAFQLDEDLYSLDAVYGAAYLFVERCYLFLSRPAECKVRVRLRTRAPTDEEELINLAGRFANELLNQMLRVRIGRSTARLREQVLARAFPSSSDGTIAQLLAELDAEELDEEPLEIAVPWEKRNDVEEPDTPNRDRGDG